jgi:hypothetical protein
VCPRRDQIRLTLECPLKRPPTNLRSPWGDAVEIDDGARMTWMRQPHYHIYMGLYPYTYSVGWSARSQSEA